MEIFSACLRPNKAGAILVLSQQAFQKKDSSRRSFFSAAAASQKNWRRRRSAAFGGGVHRWRARLQLTYVAILRYSANDHNL